VAVSEGLPPAGAAPDPERARLAERVARLESRQRWLQVARVAVVVVGALAVGASRRAAEPRSRSADFDSVRARHFLVMDADTVRGVLGMIDGPPGAALMLGQPVTGPWRVLPAGVGMHERGEFYVNGRDGRRIGVLGNQVTLSGGRGVIAFLGHDGDSTLEYLVTPPNRVRPLLKTAVPPPAHELPSASSHRADVP
jgi:hypothetical protein